MSTDALFYKISKGEDYILNTDFINYITNVGLEQTDKRIQKVLREIECCKKIEKNNFYLKTSENNLIHRVFNDELVVPEWNEFKTKISKIFEKVKHNKQGTKANVTPKIRRTNEDLFAVSICTIDGQILNLGDTSEEFCVHSLSKVLAYLIAVDNYGRDYVHKYVGKEISGESYNSLTLKKIKDGKKIRYVPHNPFTDAGAILCSSLIGNRMKESNRYFLISEKMKKATASSKIGFSHETFLSQRDNSDRRSCLAFMMRERKSFPKNKNISLILELYFQLRSLEVNTKQIAVLAATLSNGGICPLTNEKVFKPNNVRDCISLMLSCGLYDYSGEWAFKIGLPAKSSISGCIFIVVPNRMGIAIYSPRLDKAGNSTRAINFAEELVKNFSFHHLENTRSFGENEKSQPFQPIISRQYTVHSLPHTESTRNLSSLMDAAETGNLDELRSLVTLSVDLYQKNYDRRTALHLAAANNHIELVNFLILDEKGFIRSEKELSPKDRWGLTPLDAAEKVKADDITKLLLSCGALRGNQLK